ncbi:MAG: hypothetical protein K2O00_04035 [Muribaculaceae bacterium]|nr:hypothetical protein [Muribaculaceae bacterium]
MKNIIIVFGMAAMMSLAACKGGKTESVTEAEPLQMIRVDSYLLENDSVVVTDSLLPAVQFIDYLVNRSVTGDSSALTTYRESKSFQVFARDVKERFVAQDSVEKVLGAVDRNMKELTGKGIGKIYGLVNPYNVPVVTTDSTVMIGLNHYLGEDYDGYRGFENYRVRAKRAAHLPYDVTEARLVADYPMEEAPDGTLLNEMLYWGAVVNIMNQVIPQSSLSETLNLAPGEEEWLKSNTSNIWNAMIERQLLYSTNDDVADRLLYPAPKSFVINNEAPGMTGRYIGYLIVRSYLDKHPELTAADMLSPEIYNSESTLINSGFTGKN